jgi:hypothetical protein
VIFGRPFLAIANALINCRSGVMKISFGNMTVELNIFQIRKQPLDYDQMNQVCLIEEIMDEVIEESSIEDPLEACLAQFGEDLDFEKLMEQADALLETAPLVRKEKEETVVPDSPKKELKPLPDNLKYKFLGPADSLLVIIASDLVDAQEKELLDVLRERFIEIFMDDFFVFGSSFQECLHRLTLVLMRCKAKNLVLNWEKCHFMVKQGIVLGHVISHRGIEVDKAKVDLISSLPPPHTVKEIHSFLGHVGFYK